MGNEGVTTVREENEQASRDSCRRRKGLLDISNWMEGIWEYWVGLWVMRNEV